MRVQTAQGPILVRPVEGLRSKQEIAVAVRPEKMRLTRDRVDADNAFEATVIDYAYMGDITVFKLRLKDGTEVKASQANAGLEDRPLSWDETAWISFPASAGVVLTG